MGRLLRFEPGAVGMRYGELGCSGPVQEEYSSTCSHCQKGTEFRSKKEMYEHVETCRGCMRLICKGCRGKPCTPWIKIIEMKEEEDAFRDSLIKRGFAPMAAELMVEERRKRLDSLIIAPVHKPAGTLIT
jgi:hypothetical protein